MTDNKNEIIAKWCGFKKNWSFVLGDHVWVSPDSCGGLPDFQNDFNACLKWAVPELIKRKCYIKITWDTCWFVEIRNEEGDILGDDCNDSLPTAFTDALIKVIDSEERK